ncbi:MAG: family 16 glycoside hydrolase, partial [bacterium]
MRTTTLVATIALAASVPFLAALQSAPSNESPKSAPPSGGQKLGSTDRQFMNDGTPIKVDEKVMLFNGKDLSGWKAFVPDLAKDGKDPLSVWTVSNGVMQCAGRPIGYIQTEALYDNFILELSWRFDPAKGE